LKLLKLFNLNRFHLSELIMMGGLSGPLFL
jgi:hypothetical protein